ncbi:MAG: glycosyltransferase [Nitrososphaerales archaeon]|nr:glycosyltransferase [Nitrososphaerales archaeon]
MKILLVSTTSLPVPPLTYGGIERIVYDLSRGLASRGHQVTLVAAKGSRPPPDVRVILTVDPGRIAGEEVAFRIYEKELHNHDIVCDHSLLKIAAQRIPINGSVRYVPVCHTLDLPSCRMEKARLVGVSTSHARYMSEKYGREFRAVCNGIDPAEYSPILERNEKRGSFLFLGRLTPEKGARDAIKFCRSLGVGLTVVEGTGRERFSMRAARRMAKMGLPIDYAARAFYRGPFGIAYLLRAIRETRNPNCVYRTNVSHATKVGLLSQARALLFPVQDEEPFGLVAVEAMACGTPVVAYRRGSMPEIIDQGKTGYLVEAGDEESFMECMKAADHIDPVACRNRVLEYFGADRMVKDYEALFEKVMGGATW